MVPASKATINIPTPLRIHPGWRTAILVAGSGLLSVATFSFSNYLQTRGFVSVQVARIFLGISWVVSLALIVIVVMAFMAKRRILTIVLSSLVLTGALGALEWAASRPKPNDGGHPGLATYESHPNGLVHTEGIITDARTGTPVLGATVGLQNLQNNLFYAYTKTDANGKFSFDALPLAYDFRITVAKSDYQDAAIPYNRSTNNVAIQLQHVSVLNEIRSAPLLQTESVVVLDCRRSTLQQEDKGRPLLTWDLLPYEAPGVSGIGTMAMDWRQAMGPIPMSHLYRCELTNNGATLVDLWLTFHVTFWGTTKVSSTSRGTTLKMNDVPMASFDRKVHFLKLDKRETFFIVNGPDVFARVDEPTYFESKIAGKLKRAALEHSTEPLTFDP